MGLQDIEIQTPLGSSLQILNIPQDWTLKMIETAENYLATLAIEGINYEFKNWQWIEE